MKIEQIYTGCLAQGAYYIESNGEAAIVDPLRDVEPYIARAARDKAHVKFVLETHFHADFVSGHLDLHRRTDAVIVYGPLADPDFPALIATDGEELQLGDLTIKVLHTPGHTLESACFLLSEKGRPVALFSGDTLFIGDVGRPDLAYKVQGITKEQMAGMLFHSLKNKILPLPDDLILYPAHGAGSACGKNMSRDISDTLGHQKQVNYALRPGMAEDEFTTEVTAGLTPPPAYFPMNVMLNKRGYQQFGELIKRGKVPLSPDDFERLANSFGALILDTRNNDIFSAGFLPGAVNIGLDGNFAPWAGTLIPHSGQKYLVVADPGREEEVITRLARVGLEQVIGYLDGGFGAWISAGKAKDSIRSVQATELAERGNERPLPLLDVRKKEEYRREHIAGSINIPLENINDNMFRIGRDRTYFVLCEGGYRSMIFISILKARGYEKLVNIRGGFSALQECRRFPVV